MQNFYSSESCFIQWTIAHPPQTKETTHKVVKMKLYNDTWEEKIEMVLQISYWKKNRINIAFKLHEMFLLGEQSTGASDAAL